MSSAKDLQFMENDEGVHLMSAINSEFTLCGDAFDIGDVDMGQGEDKSLSMVNTKKRTVTCPRCIEQILDCKKARVKKD